MIFDSSYGLYHDLFKSDFSQGVRVEKATDSKLRLRVDKLLFHYRVTLMYFANIRVCNLMPNKVSVEV